MRGTRRAMVALGLAAVVSTGIAGSALGQTDGEKITLHVGTTSDMVSANPFKACCTSEYEMLLMNYNMLYGFSAEDLSPVEELTPGCEPSSDNMTWTCPIRDDVTWHDGQPLTAADIAFTYRFVIDNEITTFSDYLPYNPTFETPDDTTLIWHSEEPTIAPTVPPYIPIVPEHIWAPLDGKPLKEIRAYENLPSIGSGPFQLTEWKPEQFWRMEAVPGHFFGDPTIDEVVYHVYGNDEAMIQALKSSEIDFAYDIPVTLAKSLEGEENIALYENAANYHTNLAFNFGGQAKAHPKVYGTPPLTDETNHPALHDHAVRLAIAHAIDKKALADVVYQGAAIPADTFIAPDKAYWHLDIPADEEIAFDLDEANRILDEAGYTERTADGVRIDPESGEPLVLDILGITDVRGSVKSGELMTAWMREVGIEFDVRNVTETKGYEEWENGTFDAYIWSWGGDPDPDFNMSIYITSQCLGWSDGCYSNPELDALYDQQRTTFDREQRRDLVHEFQRIHYEEIPEIALVYPELQHAYRTDAFEGYVPTPTEGGGLLFGWRVDSYMSLKPVVAGGPGAVADEGGMSSGLLIGIGAIALVAIVAFVVRGRRLKEEDEA
ncbi:MAG: peptide ABC transporter substrate-binding protein [Actinomycetota bacterium]|nr:peptide ABC transporter substrate-binding protein [Actinomycetota bacterium]